MEIDIHFDTNDSVHMHSTTGVPIYFPLAGNKFLQLTEFNLSYKLWKSSFNTGI